MCFDRNSAPQLVNYEYIYFISHSASSPCISFLASDGVLVGTLYWYDSMVLKSLWHTCDTFLSLDDCCQVDYSMLTGRFASS